MCSSANDSFSSLQMLVVEYDDANPAPKLVNVTMDVSPFPHKLKVKASLSDSEGAVSCVLIPLQSNGYSYPTSCENIFAQGVVGWSSNLSAIVDLGSIESGSNYSVFCGAMSVSGSYSLWKDIWKSNFTGPCCKRIVVKTLASSVSSVSSNGYKILSVSLSSLPIHSIDIGVELVPLSVSENQSYLSVANNHNYDTLFPATTTFWGLSSDTKSYSLSNVLYINSILDIGIYYINVSLSGQSRHEYDLLFVSSKEIVITDNTIVANPVVSTCIFSDDGSNIILSFESALSWMKTVTYFTCSQYLLFSDSNTATCIWSSDYASILIYPQYYSSLEVNSTVTVLISKLSNECLKRNFVGCGNNVTNITIDSPSSPTSPTVILNAPAVIVGCGSFDMDISQSFGSCGRKWLSSLIRIKSLYSSLYDSVLESYFNSVITSAFPFSVDGGIFKFGGNYVMTVELCNYFRSCSEVSQNIFVVNSSSYPVASILSTSQVAMKSSSSLLLRSQASLQCVVRIKVQALKFPILSIWGSFDFRCILKL